MKQLKLYNSVDHWIYSETHGIVQSGPFVGMLLCEEQDWKDGNLSTKCLGCYEEELHPFVETQIARLAKLERAKIVDLGCAEGYYAIGLGRRLPQSVIYGVDISKKSLEILRKAAALNGVTNITLDAMLVEEVMVAPDLVVCDVEGDEVNYLRLDIFPDLVRSDIIVECHDSEDFHISKILQERFAPTHDVLQVWEGARDPNKFEFLRQRQSLHRWMAVCEGRPCLMNWLVMTAKARA
jgi:SAM-dependent methyltransferase